MSQGHTECGCERGESFALCFFKQYKIYIVQHWAFICFKGLKNIQDFIGSYYEVRQCMNEIYVNIIVVAGVGGSGSKTAFIKY